MNNYLVHFSLKEVIAPRCSDAWWKAGMDYLKAGGDSATWHVMMYGA